MTKRFISKKRNLILGIFLSFLCLVISPSKTSAGANFTEFPLPNPSYGSTAQVLGNNGELWFTTTHTEGTVGSYTEHYGLGKINLAGEVEEYDLTGYVSEGCTNLNSLAVLPNNDVWFACSSFVNGVGKMSSSGDITIYSPDSSIVYPQSMTVGPDGNIWYSGGGSSSEGGSTFLVKLSNSGAVLEEYDLGTFSEDESMNGTSADSLKVGPDGNFWVALSDIGYIARITSSGVVAKFEASGYSGYGPSQFTLGSDNKFWFVYYSADATAHVGSMDTNGNLQSTYSGSNSLGRNGWTTYIQEDPRGNLLVGGVDPEDSSSLVLFSATKEGQVSRYPVPHITGYEEGRVDQIGYLVKGPDGEVWYTYVSNNQGYSDPIHAFFRVIITSDDSGVPPSEPTSGSPIPTAPRTGRLLAATLVSVLIVATILLVARHIKLRMHKSSVSVK